MSAERDPILAAVDVAREKFGWRPVLLAVLAIASLTFAAALFLTEHYASAEDVERAAEEHREEHRTLNVRLDSAEQSSAVERALLERIEHEVEIIDQRLT